MDSRMVKPNSGGVVKLAYFRFD